MTKTRPARSPRRARTPSRDAAGDPAVADRGLAEGILWLLILAVPLVFSARAQDSFRLPKQLLSETLALASLVPLAWRLRSLPRIDWGALARRPLVQAVVPMALVAGLGSITSEHPQHVRGALISFGIGLICLIGWHLGLRLAELRRVLAVMTVPAVLLSVLVILQFHGLFEPFAFRGSVGERIALTSLAGGPFDLATYLVLPILIAQGALALDLLGGAGRRRWRWAWGIGLVLMLYAAALTQTLTVLIVVTLASLLLWALLLPVRRLLLALMLLAVVGGGTVLAITPLRARVVDKAASLRAGDVNTFLTGRLDGWRAAWWMLREHPWTGVGQGAYRAEFAAARLALHEEGVSFYRRQHQPFFTTAHSDLLESAAHWGWPGVLALLWAGTVLARTIWRLARRPASSPRDAVETAVLVAALLGFTILLATNFALHLALVAYPFLLLLAAAFTYSRESTP